MRNEEVYGTSSPPDLHQYFHTIDIPVHFIMGLEVSRGRHLLSIITFIRTGLLHLKMCCVITTVLRPSDPTLLISRRSHFPAMWTLFSIYLMKSSAMLLKSSLQRFDLLFLSSMVWLIFTHFQARHLSPSGRNTPHTITRVGPLATSRNS